MHHILKHPRNIRIVLGEGREVKPNGRPKLTKGQRKRAQEEYVSREVNVIEKRGKQDLGPETDSRPSDLDPVSGLAFPDTDNHTQ